MRFLKGLCGRDEHPTEPQPCNGYYSTQAIDVVFDCVNGRYEKRFDGDVYWCSFSNRLVKNNPEDFLAAFIKNWIRDGYVLMGKDIVLAKDLRGAKIVDGPYNAGLKLIEEKPA